MKHELIGIFVTKDTK